ncbi:Rnf-Nqr domain containing protein [Pseudomonas putida]
MSDYILVLISAALVNHLFLQQQPLSRLRLHVLGLACALSLVLGVSGGQLLQRVVLAPWHLQDLQLFLLLPWLALVAWCVASLLAKLRPGWPTAELPAQLMGNVMLLGLTLQVLAEGSGWFASVTLGLALGLGFWLALMLFDDLGQRCEHADIPVALRGLPIQLMGAGVMAMALCGFNGLFTQ